MAANIIRAAQHAVTLSPQNGVTVESIAKMLNGVLPDERDATECAWMIIKALCFGIYPPGYAELKALAAAQGEKS